MERVLGGGGGVGRAMRRLSGEPLTRPKKSGRAGAETAAAQRQQDAGQHSPSRHRGPGFPGLAALEGLWPRAGASVKETFLLGVPTLAPNNGRVVPLPEC